MSDNGNGKAPLQFPSPPAVPIVGQPFMLDAIGVPCNAKLRCNCGGEHVEVTIRNSEPGTCPSCARVYNVAFNPTQNKLEFTIGVPKETVPS